MKIDKIEPHRATIERQSEEENKGTGGLGLELLLHFCISLTFAHEHANNKMLYPILTLQHTQIHRQRTSVRVPVRVPVLVLVR